MDHDTNDCVGGDPRPRAQRWLAAAVAPVSLLLVAGTMAISSPGSALIPQPTTTVPGRPTTTTTVVGRPTTVPAPRETTTTTTTQTTDPPVTATTVTPTTAAPTTVSPPSLAETTSTIDQPIPEPPSTPPTSEPEVAPFVMSSPVIVDPEDPAAPPPVIVNAATWCPKSWPDAWVQIVVQNVDLFHYPPPFEATYSWTFAYDGGEASGQLTLSGGESEIVMMSTSITGPGTFTVTDDELGGTDTVEVEMPDCTGQNPPAADPLAPLVLVPMATCAEDFNADSGTGTISFLAQNPPGDDGGTRSYDFSVTWVESQQLEDDGSLGDVDDSQWVDHESVALHSGTYTVTVTDQADAALTASVPVDVPPCEPEPPTEPIPPLAAPRILSVTTQCADPVLLDGTVGFVVLNANYLFLGGSGELGYELTLVSDSPAVETVVTYNASPGVEKLGVWDLAPAAYTATFSFLEFPELTDTVTFTIDDCSVNPQVPAEPLDVYGLTAFCLPGDGTETLFFVFDLLHPGFVEWVEWSVIDGYQTLADESLEDPVWSTNPVAVRHLPAGAYDLVVETHVDPLVEMTLPIEIGTCADPTDPADPADPADPVATTDPADPADPADPVASTDPEQPTTTSQPTDPTGTLPPTALSGALPATR